MLGTLKEPKTNGVSVTWSTPPKEGESTLRAVIHLSFGEIRTFDGPTITVK